METPQFSCPRSVTLVEAPECGCSRTLAISDIAIDEHDDNKQSCRDTKPSRDLRSSRTITFTTTRV